tara:strand:+ start:4771 stop:5088 length:318 start_codon:yes stop_codon:yes gene_type:complete
VDCSPYEVVLRLIGIAGDNWEAIDYEAACQGQDFLALPIDRFCNVVYHWAMERVKDKPQFIYQLTKRVSGQKPSKKQVNEDADAFMAFAGAFGVAPPSASPDLDS